MDSDDSYNARNPSDIARFDPSTISLNSVGGNASRSLTQKLSIVTDHSLDSPDYGSPLLSADLDSASPSVDVDGSKRQHISYSSYLSGRAQEVAKRRQLIERLEKARDNGILMSTIPQLSELTITQLSMVLRRALKSSSGLREFVSDEVLQHIFEDATTSQTPITSESDKIHQFPDLPNEPNCLTDHETDVSDEDDTESNFKYELSIRDSSQPDYYSVRRKLIASDRFAASFITKLIEKQSKLKNLIKYDEFAHESPPSGSDPETNSLTCVRCRPLINKPTRKLYRVDAEPKLLRSTSPPPSIIVNGQSDIDFDPEHREMLAMNVFDKISVEHVMQSYLYQLGTIQPHCAAKNHAAFPELGKKKQFFGFPSAVQSELTNFPHQLKPVNSSVTAQKRRHDSVSNVEEENNEDYPLLKQKFVLKNPPKLVKSKSVYISPPKMEHERVAPLRIKRSSIQIPHTASASLGRFINPFYNTHTSPIVKEVELPMPVQQPISLSESQETIRTSPKSSSSSSSSSDDSSSSDSDSDEKPQSTFNQHGRLDQEGSSAANNPVPAVDKNPLDSGNESDNESSSSSEGSVRGENDENAEELE